MRTSHNTLLSEGFAHVATRPVALPHDVWKAEIDIEFDRRLRVVEEALLKLIAAGVSDTALLQRLLGLQDEPIVPRYLAELMRTGRVASVDDRLVLTTLGKQALSEDAARERRTCPVTFRHDPYRDELLWTFDDHAEVKDKELEAAGLIALPKPEGLTHSEVALLHPEIRRLAERDGLPFEDKKRPKGERIRRPEVLHLRPEKPYTAYRSAELEVWYRESDKECRWVLLMAGGEVIEATTKLRQMEADGRQILPIEDMDRFKPGPKEEALQEALDVVTQLATPSLLDTAAHRPALEQAIKDASRNLIIISPWIRPAAVDQEMLDWFRKGMEKNKELAITIGYGIDGEDELDRHGQKTRKAREQESAISRLHEVSQKFRGRLQLVKIGNTHEKIVVVDEAYAIITSYNFLSFNPRPGKGIRRETGYRLSDARQVQELRTRLVQLLESATGSSSHFRRVAR